MDRKQEIDDLKTVLATPGGRRFLWRMLGQAGVFRSSFVSAAPEITAYNEGARNLGLSVMGEIISEAPESFLTMQREAMEDEQRRKAEAERKKSSGDSDDRGTGD